MRTNEQNGLAILVGAALDWVALECVALELTIPKPHHTLVY